MKLFVERDAHGAGGGEGAAAGAAVSGDVGGLGAASSAVGAVEDPVVVGTARRTSVCKVACVAVHSLQRHVRIVFIGETRISIDINPQSVILHGVDPALDLAGG